MKPMKYNTPKQRLKIYERALKIMIKRNWKEFTAVDDGGICFLLSCLISGLPFEDYSSPTAREAANRCPEFGAYHDGNICKKYELIYKTDTHEWRIKVLTEIINKLKNS